MKKNQTSRREFVKNSVAGMGLFTLPQLLNNENTGTENNKKIVVVGGHPDDPESGVGGTALLLVSAGHEVVFMYLTNGDAGIEGKTHSEAAAIRKNESEAACKIIGARPLFVNQVDGDSVINNAELARFQQLLWNEKPDVVFTHWPVDSHKDHQLASVFTIQAWLHAHNPFSLYFYEVCTGNQSYTFHPTDYADITETQLTKWKALACHASQNLIGPDGKYSKEMQDCGHAAMEDFRGRELGVHAAEAFVRMTGRGMGKLVM